MIGGWAVPVLRTCQLLQNVVCLLQWVSSFSARGLLGSSPQLLTQVPGSPAENCRF